MGDAEELTLILAQSLKTSWWTDNRTFKLRILRRYSQHVRTINFDGTATADQLVSLLERASSFAGLHRLDI